MRNASIVFAAVVLSVGGVALTGCQNPNQDNTGSSASNPGIGGGGSTDTYGTSTNARYNATGNIGTGVAPGSNTPTPSDSQLYPNNAAAAPTTANTVGGETAGAPAGGTSTVGNQAGPQDQTPKAARTSVRPNGNPTNGGAINGGNTTNGGTTNDGTTTGQPTR